MENFGLFNLNFKCHGAGPATRNLISMDSCLNCTSRSGRCSLVEALISGGRRQVDPLPAARSGGGGPAQAAAASGPARKCLAMLSRIIRGK
jgi:hypothetical protein